MAERTTVGMTKEVKEKLREYKFDSRCESFDEAVAHLLENAGIDAATEDAV